MHSQKLPTYTYKDVARKLTKLGCVFKKRAGGSHETRYSPYNQRVFTVVNHGGKDMNRGTLKHMLDSAQITKEMFRNA